MSLMVGLFWSSHLVVRKLLPFPTKLPLSSFNQLDLTEHNNLSLVWAQVGCIESKFRLGHVPGWCISSLSWSWVSCQPNPTYQFVTLLLTYIFHVRPHLTPRLVFYSEKLIFEKVGVTTYFCLFLKRETKIRNKTQVAPFKKKNMSKNPKPSLRVRLLIRKIL